MYTPEHFAYRDRHEIAQCVRRAGLGHLVTHHGHDAAPAFMATALPFIVDDDLTSVRAHFARANRHWQSIDGTDGLLIVPGLDAYISPRWYPSKLEHGKVVPTWNYELVHLHGRIEIHDDVEWKRRIVEDLTNDHEGRVSLADNARAWQVADAPADFIDGQLKAIVGVQMTITTIEAKRKLSQNRDDIDRIGAAAGLGASPHQVDRDVALLMGHGDRPDEGQARS